MLSGDGRAVAALCKKNSRNFGVPEERCKNPQRIMEREGEGCTEEGCCVMDIVHERAWLTAVVQCSGVCEATALAKRSAGKQCANVRNLLDFFGR